MLLQERSLSEYSSLQSLQAEPTDKMTTALCEKLNKLGEKQKIVLQWIPAHIGIAGNEVADLLAKSGSRLPQPASCISYEEAKTLLKNKDLHSWQSRNDGYNLKKDGIHSLSRKAQTTVFRLRTGHCNLNKHKKKMGLTETAQCQCGAAEQTPEHILQTCPHFEEARRQVWPMDTPVTEKLWGTSENLLCTANFVDLTGRDV